MNREIITEADAAAVGVKREVYQDWADVMQAIWTAAIEFYKGAQKERYLPKNGENEILVGGEFRISANMVNNSYVDVNLYYQGKEIVTIRYVVDVTTICICIFKIIKAVTNEQ